MKVNVDVLTWWWQTLCNDQQIFQSPFACNLEICQDPMVCVCDLLQKHRLYIDITWCLGSSYRPEHLQQSTACHARVEWVNVKVYAIVPPLLRHHYLRSPACLRSKLLQDYWRLASVKDAVMFHLSPISLPTCRQKRYCHLLCPNCLLEICAVMRDCYIWHKSHAIYDSSCRQVTVDGT